MKLLLSLNTLFVVFLLSAQAVVLDHVEPANWWVGMKHHQIQVLLHGPQIAKYTVNVQGLNVLGIVKTENPNYLFVTVETKDRNAGTYPITLTNTKNKEVARFEFKLEERIYQSAKREGFSTKDVIYLLMPDRFANVYPGQDTYPGMAEPGNRSLPGGRHGGDIAGIMEHLDYIKELGATTIWTTPLLEDNEPTYSYHGYAQSDLYKVDPRYGTNSWFKELVLESHRRGLKVIKDEVPNHWSSKHWMIQDLPTKTWIHQFDQFTRSSYRTSTQMDPYAAPTDHSASADGWFDTSMPDMNQSNPLLLTYLIQNTIWWVEYACLDGLRVDTYSYNDKNAIATWTKAIMEEYPRLNMVGEVWLHNQAQISYWQKDSKIGALDSYNSGLPAVMDFTLHDAIMQAFNERNQGWDQGMARIYENFVNDFVYENPNNMLVFMENHDTKRFNEYCPNLADYKLALTLIATTRGIPQLYYGSEIGMKGSKDVGDADIRRDFPGGWDTDTLTAFYAQDDVRKRSKLGRTPEQESYFQFTKKVLNWRKNQAVIHDGTLVQYVPENNVYVYFRILGEKKIMVVLNNSMDAQSIATSRFVDVLDKFSIRAVPLKKEVLSDTFIDMSQKIINNSRKNSMDHRIVGKVLVLVLFTWINLNAWSQNPTRQFKSIASIPAGIKVTVSDGEYIFRSYGPNIIETTFIPNGQKHEANSHTVEKKPDENSFTWAATSNALIPPFIHIYHKEDRDKKMDPTILIQTNPFKITYWHKGRYLLSERWGYDEDSSMEKIQFNLSKDEKLFGTGNRVLGMDRRGYRLPLYNKAHYGYETHSEQMNYSMPLVISDRLYALHFDNSYTGFLDLDSKKDSSLTYETTGGRKTYQVIAADNWKELVASYTSLTGRQPLPPRWAFGNFASRFGYHSEQEARDVVSKFKSDSIPLDAIVFDLYWFGTTIQGTLGNFEFHRDSFPNPKQMISDFKNTGVKTVLITEPFILTTSKTWEETKTKKLLCTDFTGEKPYTYDFYFGNTGLLDIYKPETKQWFWNIYKGLIEMGVEGIWGDLGEPEVHPDDLYHVVGRANRVHNIYGHDWARLIQEGYRADFSNKRPFILMRSGYSGSQRFGMIPWTGDVNRTWGGLKPQVELTLQAGLQGIGYLHSDLGGFGGANDDPELYVRWLQYGVFQPIFRPHAQQEVPSEAIFKDPQTKARAKEAIEWRYRLLPYNYTLAYENSTTGIPLMRPVFMEYPKQTDFMDRTDCYFWGPDMFVVPVTEKGQKIAKIDFPDSNPWFNLYTDELVVPQQFITRARCFWGSRMEMVWNESTIDSLTMDNIPVFVKAGAFIPMAEKGIQSTEEYSVNKVEVHFYYDPTVSTSKGKLFEDDGNSRQDFDGDCYTLFEFDYLKKSAKKSVINVKSTSPFCKPFSPGVTLVIHNVSEAPRIISKTNDQLLGEDAKITFDSTTKTARLIYILEDGNELKIKFH